MRPVLPWYRSVRAQALALFFLGFALYANTLGHDFTLDDAIVITDNSVVQRGIPGWVDLFTHDTFYGFFGEQERASLVAGGRYRPLTPAMFALEGELADGRPLLFHLFNVLWYATLGVVLFFMLRELLRDRGMPWWVPLGTAALFVAHPIHTEAVANVKGRDEIIALLGAVAASWCVLRAARKRRWGAASAGGMLFLAGCLAKENTITFLAVLPVFLLATKRGGFHFLLPSLVAAVAYLFLRFAVIGTGLGEPSTELMNNPFLKEAGGGVVGMTFLERLPTVAYTALLYLKLLCWPVGLVHDYYPAAIELKAWTDPLVWISLIGHLALVAWAALHLRSRRPVVAAGILTYVFTLSIVSNLVFSVGTLMSERFLFMPSVGFALAVVALLASWKRGWWVLIGVVPVFCVLTVTRNPVWKDNYTLFTTDIVRQPRSAKLLNAAAGARLDRYQQLPEPERARSRFLLDSAVRHLDAALVVHPRYGNAYLLRGNAFFLLGDYQGAISEYESAVAFGVSRQTVDGNLALALQQAGREAGEQRNDLVAARGYLERSLALAPENYETLRLLGITYGMGGDSQRAYDYFERALRVDPGNAGAQRNLEIARQQMEQASN
ncbi:Tfp pilus assembly protein PilF [Neolewinella xylanilytica]|uniref:Tfp pilus assembly protein PilF n=1 Tax=Neolewinella xylanilytica TaxID=1514080 RepID=A0A2S6IBG0_9BACT|nr:tetratricopeptide repeat protein [Neolewinella xylanilytica]PPK88841.1 Tfp pilus assembly protein PilF [Neolewinella xylanilytica]